MAGTERTRTALDALVDTAGGGGTTGQDLLDILWSVLGGYGSIYLNNGSTAQGSITATPAKLTGFAANGVSSTSVTPDHTNDKITVTVPGDYYVFASYSFSGSASSTFEIEIYKNTSGTGYALERKLGVGGDVGNASCGGLITCAANDEISLYISSSDGGTSVTPSQAQLIVTRVS